MGRYIWILRTIRNVKRLGDFRLRRAKFRGVYFRLWTSVPLSPMWGHPKLGSDRGRRGQYLSPSLAAIAVAVTELSTFENPVAASATRDGMKRLERSRDIKLLHIQRVRSRLC
jgi:hypothetical protein